MLGFILAAYSAANMTGNVLAGPLIDRFGSKAFIVGSLTLGGVLLLFQGMVTSPAELLSLRMVTGFVIAFLSPACFALLGKLGKDLEAQGRIMAKNGMMITLASIVAPVAGGLVADWLGFGRTFLLFGALLALGGVLGVFVVHEHRAPERTHSRPLTAGSSLLTVARNTALLPAYLATLTTSLGQGILMYEVPYVMAQAGKSSAATGFLLTVMGAGSLSTLGIGWLNRFSPYSRCFVALAVIAATFYALTLNLNLSLSFLMFVKGAAHGLMFPAKTTILTGGAARDDYGKVFGIHSAVLSGGFVLGPLVAGTLRTMISPFFVTFVFTMVMTVIFIALTGKTNIAPVAWKG